MTARIGALGSMVRDARARSRGYLLVLVPVVLAVAALLVF